MLIIIILTNLTLKQKFFWILFVPKGMISIKQKNHYLAALYENGLFAQCYDFYLYILQ